MSVILNIYCAKLLRKWVLIKHLTKITLITLCTLVEGNPIVCTFFKGPPHIILVQVLEKGLTRKPQSH